MQGSQPPSSSPKPPSAAHTERLSIEPYAGPVSHHALRAFAASSAPQKNGVRRVKGALVVALVVLGAAAAWGFGACASAPNADAPDPSNSPGPRPGAQTATESP